MRRSLHVLGLLALAGCGAPTLPPMIGFSKFARQDLPEGKAETEHGKVSASTGPVIYTEEVGSANNAGFVTFYGEGSLSAWLASFYDLTVGASPFVLGVEGNLAPIRTERLRVGLIHGIGGAFSDSANHGGGSSAPETDIFLDFSVGPFVQVTAARGVVLFAGAKYTFATYSRLSGSTRYNNTNYIASSLGASIRVASRLSLAPELIVTYLGYSDYVGVPANPPWRDAWFITPMITASATF